MKPKVIELKNVNALNKGAHLMLKAILGEFANRKVDNVIFSAMHGFGRDYFTLGANHLYQTLKPGRKRTLLSSALQVVPFNLRRELGIVLDTEVDHILDASGFAYGDFWGTSKPDQAYLDHIAKVKKKGGKLVLLPQALGPFKSQDVIDNFAPLAKAADLIIARDRISYDHLNSAFGNSTRYQMFPDFTNLVSTPDAWEYREGNVCIIPNYKMLKGKEEQADKYDEWLRHVCIRTRENGYKPYWLIHEGQLDKEIAERVNENLSEPLPIVLEDDPILIKHRIKSCPFIVVSRFHGLVSALSQGVPAISTSWSHKYRMLMEDYASDEFLVDVFSDTSIADTDLLLRQLTDPTIREELHHKIESNAADEKAKSKAMWDLVFSTLSL
jgi:colanic acid/amylovoran biosynthesis protein